MRIIRTLIALVGLTLGLVPAGAALAQVEYVTLQTEGTGRTMGHAVGSALREAISQVNGAHVAGSMATAEATAAIETRDDSVFVSASAFAEAIATQTKGAIKEYRIIKKSREGSLWTVTVEAAVARYAASPQVNRLRMAVIPFRLKHEAQKPFRDHFTQELVTHLTQSRKFAMLDRQFGAERQRELDLLASGSAPPAEMARLGNTLGTDYLVVGVIEDASQAVRTVAMQSANRTFTLTTANVRLSYRIVDAATGQIKFSESFTRSSEEDGVDALTKGAAEEVSRQILEAIFPVLVESVSGDVLYLGQGGKALRAGQRFRIVRYGKELRDSYTKESLGREEVDVGVAEITDVQAKFAKAKIVKQTVDIGREFAPETFLLRPLKQPGAAVQAARGPAAPPASATPPERPKSDLKKKVEGDW